MKKYIALGSGGLIALLAVVLAIAVVAIVAVLGGVTATIGGGMGAIAGHQAKKMEGGGQCTAEGGGASGTPISASQAEYVKTVIGIAKTMNVSENGQIIAMMVMLQESGIKNYANNGQNHFGYDIGRGTAQSTAWWLETAKISLEYPHDAVGKDADSVGLFQQRPAAGWGDGGGYKAGTSSDHGRKAIERLLDPKWSAQAFFGGEGGAPNRGLTDISGWESMSLASAAQTVQGSAFPLAYAKWEGKARSLVAQNSDAPAVPLLDASAGGTGDGGTTGGTTTAGGAQIEYPMKEGTYTITSEYGPREAPTEGASTNHQGTDFGAAAGTPIYAAADGIVAAAGHHSGFGNWVVIDHTVNGQKVSTVYGHMTADSITVEKGDDVNAGDQIATVGSEGVADGPHLHFEVWQGGRLPDGTGTTTNPITWLQSGNATSNGGATDCTPAGGGVNLAGSAATGTAKQVIDAAKTQLGIPYSWGGGAMNGPAGGFGSGAGVIGFDCSSLMRYAVYQGTGKSLTLPRVSHDQWNATKSNQITWSEMQPGDLMFWARGGRVYHVAMYLGDNMMIEAPKPGGHVQIVTTNGRQVRFLGATRLDYKPANES